jgi:hypothetical protein
MLDASFTPDPMDPNSAPGSAGPITNQKITTDLINAFNLAPQRLRDQLCGSGGNPGVSVFVQNCAVGPTGCGVGSWGYRKRQGGAKFIALSAGLWQGTSSALSYPVFETTVLNNLLGTNLASYTSASNDSPEMTVLAVLAHEMGHILAWQKSVINSPCANPPPGVNPIFWQIAWNNAANPKPFHHFGDQANGDQRKRGPSKDDVKANSGNPPFARILLAQIYGGDWASLLGNVAPDEDLIETYKLYIMNTANNIGKGPQTSLVVNIPNIGSIDIIQDLFLNSSTWLFKKRAWVNNCFA